jgi:hypothetical protein
MSGSTVITILIVVAAATASIRLYRFFSGNLELQEATHSSWAKVLAHLATWVGGAIATALISAASGWPAGNVACVVFGIALIGLAATRAWWFWETGGISDLRVLFGSGAVQVFYIGFGLLLAIIGLGDRLR